MDLPKLSVIELATRELDRDMLQGQKLSKQCNYNTVNKVVPLFTFKLKCEFNKLPPIQAAFKYKIFRSHYVTLVLKRTYLAIILGYGWEAKDDIYVPITLHKK